MRYRLASLRRAVILTRVLGVLLVVLCVIIGTMRETSDGAQQTAQEDLRVQQGCVILQETTYARCGHKVVTRAHAQSHQVGMTRKALEETLGEYRMLSFMPMEITLSRQIALHCPAHYVVMPDVSGVLGIFQNSFGDALAFVRTLDVPMSDFDQTEQEALLQGRAFDSLADIEQWLEALGS